MAVYTGNFFKDYFDTELELTHLNILYNQVFYEELSKFQLALKPNLKEKHRVYNYVTPQGNFNSNTFKYLNPFYEETNTDIKIPLTPPMLNDFLKQNHEAILIKRSLISMSQFLDVNIQLLMQWDLSPPAALLLRNISSTLWDFSIAPKPDFSPYTSRKLKIQRLDTFVEQYLTTVNSINSKFALGIYPKQEDIPF